MHDDFDTPWKDVLENYFQEFMEFFFPDAANDIAWETGYTFLDKEFQQVTREAEQGRRYADKLVRVFRAGTGDEVWVLIHVEVQANREQDFAARMFTYNYRIYDRYQRPVVSLAVLADPAPTWRPDGFSWELWGCRMGLRFPVAKLLDYRAHWEELILSHNPFAVCTMAHLKSIETKKDPISRQRWKVKLARSLYESGRDRQYVINLFHFIDWLMRLPKELEQDFWNEIRQIEEEKTMPYVSSVEQMGLERGLQQGIEQGIQQGIEQGMQRGAQAVLLRQLHAKFGVLPDDILNQVEQADPEQIEKWSEQILTAENLHDLFNR